MSQRLIARCRRKVLQQVVRRFCVRHNYDDELIRLGSEYGGWWVPALLLVPGTTVLSAGVGEDTTFDEEMLSRGCEVWAIDPTPRAATHVASRSREIAALSNAFHFWPVGLWHQDAQLQFYVPENPDHVSHSVVNAQRTRVGFIAECWSLEHVLRETRRDTIDVLKLDIEGAEIEVLRRLIETAIRPSVICVELDTPLPERRALKVIRDVTRSGYRLANVDGWNLLFLHRSLDK